MDHTNFVTKKGAFEWAHVGEKSFADVSGPQEFVWRERISSLALHTGKQDYERKNGIECLDLASLS